MTSRASYPDCGIRDHAKAPGSTRQANARSASLDPRGLISHQYYAADVDASPFSPLRYVRPLRNAALGAIIACILYATGTSHTRVIEESSGMMNYYGSRYCENSRSS